MGSSVNELPVTETVPYTTRETQLHQLKQALYEALKAILPKDMSEGDFELFVILENEFAA